MLIPLDPATPCEPGITCGTLSRSPENYLAVARQFSVESNPRYTPRDIQGNGHVDTFCNIFASDVLKAMGCEPGHFFMGNELSANRMVDWYDRHAKDYAWREVTEVEARENAARGCPTIVIWKNPSLNADGRPKSGHVAVVLPCLTPDTMIAQAGAHNFFNGPLAGGFGTGKQLRFFAHD